MTAVHSYQEFLERYLPEEAKRRRRARMTPEELARDLGQQLAREALGRQPCGTPDRSGQ